MNGNYTYIIKSKIKEKYYIGTSSNLVQRLKLHNEGHSKSTKAFVPWEIVYSEKFATKHEALKREKELKNMKSKKYLEWLINNNSRGRPD